MTDKWTLEVFRGLNSRWYYHWRAPNGRITINGSNGSGFRSRRKAKHHAKRVAFRIAQLETPPTRE